jgi:hypothetical protein
MGHSGTGPVHEGRARERRPIRGREGRSMPGDARRIGRPVFLAMGVVIAIAAVAAAQSSSGKNVTATFVVTSQAILTVSSATLTFPNADPDTVARIPASEGPLTVTVASRSTSGSAIVLTVQASDDLRSGLATIAVSALTWTASGIGFLGGTMSKTAQTVGSWTTTGNSTGVLTFGFANGWTYSVGSYRTTITYTLTVP